MTTDDMVSTTAEAYEMARTVALETLKDLMTEDDLWIRLYAAEAVLENEPKEAVKSDQNRD